MQVFLIRCGEFQACGGWEIAGGRSWGRAITGEGRRFFEASGKSRSIRGDGRFYHGDDSQAGCPIILSAYAVDAIP